MSAEKLMLDDSFERKEMNRHYYTLLRGVGCAIFLLRCWYFYNTVYDFLVNYYAFETEVTGKPADIFSGVLLFFFVPSGIFSTLIQLRCITSTTFKDIEENPGVVVAYWITTTVLTSISWINLYNTFNMDSRFMEPIIWTGIDSFLTTIAVVIVYREGVLNSSPSRMQYKNLESTYEMLENQEDN